MAQDWFTQNAPKPKAQPAQQDWFTANAPKQAAAVRVRPSQEELASQGQSSLLTGFMSEAGKRARQLGSAIMDTTGDLEVDAHQIPLISESSKGAAAWAGLRSFIPAIKESPVAQAVTALGRKVGLLNPKISNAQVIEQKLAPSGIQSKRTAMEVARTLADDAALVNSSKGLPFDRTLFNRFRASANALSRVESRIPDVTPVSTKDIAKGFDELIEQYTSVGADDAVKALTAQKERLVRSGESIPWNQFIANKRRFGHDLQKIGTWKRLMSDAATEKDYALAQAYGRFMEASSGISEELAAANRTFSMFHDAVTSAGLDLDTGRRLITIGKELGPSRLVRGGKALLKAGAIGGAAAGGAKLYDSMK